MALSRILSQGRITIPKQVRERLGLQAGDALEFWFEDDRLAVRPVPRRRVKDFRGLFHVPQAPEFTEERARAWSARAREISVAGEEPYA